MNCPRLIATILAIVGILFAPFLQGATTGHAYPIECEEYLEALVSLLTQSGTSAQGKHVYTATMVSIPPLYRSTHTSTLTETGVLVI